MRRSTGPTLAWVDPSSARHLQPVWVSRAGVASPVTGVTPGDYRWPRVSPDGRRIAFGEIGKGIEVLDPATGLRFVIAPSGPTEPVWLHDGRVVTSLQAGPHSFALLAHSANGGRAPDTLRALAARDAWPSDVSRDDGLLFYYSVPPGSDEQDIYILDMRTRAERQLARPGEQRGARLSPDGRWLAMESHVGARSDVIVMPWPAADAQYVVAPDGGTEPTWSRDGKELFFRSGSRVMAVPVAAGSTWQARPPVELFHGPFAADIWGDQSWDVAPDGRFLMLQYTGDSRLRIRVIENWTTELHQKLDGVAAPRP